MPVSICCQTLLPLQAGAPYILWSSGSGVEQIPLAFRLCHLKGEATAGAQHIWKFEHLVVSTLQIPLKNWGLYDVSNALHSS